MYSFFQAEKQKLIFHQNCGSESELKLENLKTGYFKNHIRIQRPKINHNTEFTNWVSHTVYLQSNKAEIIAAVRFRHQAHALHQTGLHYSEKIYITNIIHI